MTEKPEKTAIGESQAADRESQAEERKSQAEERKSQAEERKSVAWAGPFLGCPEGAACATGVGEPQGTGFVWK